MTDEPTTDTSIVAFDEDTTWELAETMPVAIAPVPACFTTVAAAIEALTGMPLWAEPPVPAHERRARKGLLVYELPMSGRPTGLTVWAVKMLAAARGNLEVTIPRDPRRGPWSDIRLSEDETQYTFVEVPAVICTSKAKDLLTGLSYEAQAVEEMIRPKREKDETGKMVLTGKLSKLEQAERSAQSKAHRDAIRQHLAAIEGALKLHLTAEMRAGHEFVTGEVDPQFFAAERTREVVREQRRHRGEEPLGNIEAALFVKTVGAIESSAGLKSGTLLLEYQAYLASAFPGTKKASDLPTSAGVAIRAWLRNRCSLLKVAFPEDVLKRNEDAGGSGPATEPDPPGAPPADPEPPPEPATEPAPANGAPTPAQAILIAFDEACESRGLTREQVGKTYRQAGLDPKRRAQYTEDDAKRLLALVTQNGGAKAEEPEEKLPGT